MWKLIVHNLTLLTFLVHAVFGCCAHHVHAALAEQQVTSTRHRSHADMAVPVHTCHRHHAESHSSHSDESKLPTDESDTCEQTACVYVDGDSGPRIQQKCSDWKCAAFPAAVSEVVRGCDLFAAHVNVPAQSAADLSALRTRAALQSWQV